MKTTLMIALGSLACSVAAAQEVGRVLSSTPAMQPVAVPQQVCSNQLVALPAQRSGAGAAIGAIAGAVLGNAVGHGGGRAASTMIGAIGGAVVGDRIEDHGATQLQNVQRCTTQTVVENRVAYYDVVYEYAGRQYTTQLTQDPGPLLQLQVTPVQTAAAPIITAPLAQVPRVLEPGVYTAPPVFIAVAPPQYVDFYPRPWPRHAPRYAPQRAWRGYDSPSIGVQLQWGGQSQRWR